MFASQAQCSADGARKHQKRLKDEWQFDERDRCKRQKEAECTASGGLNDGAPERYPPHQEPRKRRNANGTEDRELCRIEEVGDAAGWQ